MKLQHLRGIHRFKYLTVFSERPGLATLDIPQRPAPVRVRYLSMKPPLRLGKLHLDSTRLLRLHVAARAHWRSGNSNTLNAFDRRSLAEMEFRGLVG